MDSGMDGIFGIIALACGLYCFYAFYLLKFKKQITTSILLSKGMNVKNCKDYKGYCAEAQKPVLLVAVVTTLYGGVDLYNTYVGGVDVLFLIMLIALIPTLVIYAVFVKKLNAKYF